MRNTGCVRKSDVRAQRRAGCADGAASSPRRRVDAERAAHRVDDLRGVVVSSSAMPSVSASTTRRLMPRSRAAASDRVGPSGHAHA